MEFSRMRWTLVFVAMLLCLSGVPSHGPAIRAPSGGSSPPEGSNAVRGEGNAHPGATGKRVDARGHAGEAGTTPVRTSGALMGPRWYDSTPGLPASSLWNGLSFTDSTPPALYGAAMATDPNASRGSMSLLYGGASSTGIPQ